MNLSFGALAPKIGAQLDAQGLKCDRRQCAFWQKTADAIVLLSAQGLISQAAIVSARKKLTLKIAEYLSKTIAGAGDKKMTRMIAKKLTARREEK